MKIFIAGCARSGTTLLIKLMSCFKNVDAHANEMPFDLLDTLERPGRHVVIKRTPRGHVNLEALPPDVGLIYSVRHPLDVLTSYRPDSGKRTFYVTEKRWRPEYAALKILREAQPSRKITYVRYNDLVSEPDAVQQKIAAAFGLEVERRFSEFDPPIFTTSVGKYERDPALWASVCMLPHAFRLAIKEFCDEFGFELPPGYLSAVSPLQAEIKNIVGDFMSRNR